MHHKLARALLENCCHRVSALIAFDCRGAIIDIHLFDTELCTHTMCIAPHTDQIWLMSGHDDGWAEPYAQDWQNLSHLCRLAGECPIRLFLASEYWPCREIIAVKMAMNSVAESDQCGDLRIDAR